MLKTGKKILCTLLVVIMCLTSAPLQGFVGFDIGSWVACETKAAGLELNENDYITTHENFVNSEEFYYMLENGGLYNNIDTEKLSDAIVAGAIWELIGDAGEMLTLQFSDSMLLKVASTNPYDLILADLLISYTSGVTFNVASTAVAFDVYNKSFESLMKMLRNTDEWEDSYDEAITFEVKGLLRDPEYKFSDSNAYKVFEKCLGKLFDKGTIVNIFNGLDCASKISEAIGTAGNLVDGFLEAYHAYTASLAFLSVSDYFAYSIRMAETYMDGVAAVLLEAALSNYEEKISSDEDAFYYALEQLRNSTAITFWKIVESMFSTSNTKFLAKVIGREAVDLGILTFTYNTTYKVLDCVFKHSDTTNLAILTFAASLFEKGLNFSTEILADALRKNLSIENAQFFDCSWSMLQCIEQYGYKTAAEFSLSKNLGTRFIKFFNKSHTNNDMEAAGSWQSAWSSAGCHGAVIRTSKDVLVQCPVDIEVYDKEDKLLFVISDDTVDPDYKDTFVEIYGGDKKFFSIPCDTDCKVVIRSREDGKMSYKVFENNNFSTSRVVEYNDIQLEVGKVFEGDIPSQINVSADSYNLITDGEVVEFDYDSLPPVEDNIVDVIVAEELFDGFPVEVIDLVTDTMFNMKSVVDLSAYDISIDDAVALFSAVAKYYPAEYSLIANSDFTYKIIVSPNLDRIMKIRFYYGDDANLDTYQKRVNDLNAEIDALVAKVEGMNEFEKALYIHDYIVLNCEYDLELLDILKTNGTLTGELRSERYTEYSVLVNGTGICGSYALAYRAILNAAGMECLYLSSAQMNHAWNMVKIDGKWYHVDCCWDDPTPDTYGRARRTYFLRTDDEIMNLNHYSWTPGQYKATSEKYSDMPRNYDIKQKYDDGTWYYLTGSTLYSSDEYGKNETEITTISASSIDADNGNIYYSTGRYIYEYDIENDERNLVYMLSNKDSGDKLSDAYLSNIYIDGENVEFYKSITKNNKKTTVYETDLLHREKFASVTGVSLSSENLELNIFDESTLTANIVSSGSVDGLDIVWSSTDESIVSVDKNGKIKGLKIGEASITASIGDYSAACIVNVVFTGEEVTGTCGENLIWSFEPSKGLLTISGSGDMHNYSYSTPWEGIKKYIINVVIDSGVESIGDYVFYNCTNLTNISIPNTITHIGSHAFDSCESLVNITIPGSVATFGTTVFHWCTGLRNVIIENGVTSISSWMFRGCKNLTSITIPESVTSIGYFAFDCCSSLINVKIPNNVTSIEGGAFYGCLALENVVIPYGITEIESETFRDCRNLKNVTIPESVNAIGSGTFEGCSSITSIVIPYGVTEIEYGAFRLCESLSSVEIPNSVKSIGSEAFMGCRSLIDVNIPDSVTSIGENTFSSCSSLRSINIPDSVTNIGDYAFSFCDSLAELVIGSGVTTIDYDAFYGSHYLQNISVDINNEKYSSDSSGVLFNKDKTELIKYPANNERSSYIIPDSVLLIGNHAFSSSKNLTSVYIPDSVIIIGSWSFEYCRNLENIMIPDSVTSIGFGGFYNCSGVNSITIGQSVSTIGEEAFESCGNLNHIIVDSNNEYYSTDSNGVLFNKNQTNLIRYPRGKTKTFYQIPESVEIIANKAFAGCKNLSRITMSNNIRTIESRAFAGCSFESVSISDSVTTIDSYAFSACNNLASIIIPGSVTSIGYNAFDDCKNLKNVIFAEGVTQIGSEMFNNCKNLTSIVIPKSITSISSGAFKYCENLLHIGYSGTKKQFEAISIHSWYNEKLTNAPYIHYNFDLATDTTHIEEETPTCTEDGYSAYDYCIDCKCDLNGSIILATGHSYGLTETKEGTCTTVPYDVYTCSYCSDSYTVTGKAEEGHNYEKIVIVPSCTEKGYTKEICTICGETLLSDLTSPKGHEFIIDKSAGYCSAHDTVEYSCKNCDYTECVAADTANLVTETVTIEPTCTKSGTESEICTLCGAKVSVEILNPLSHDYSDEWTVDTEPTCTEKGSKSKHCTRCDAKREVTIVGEAGHKYYDRWLERTSPTCEKDGLEYRNCYVCNNAEETRIAGKLGHNYSSNWTVDVEPTCTTTGSKSHHCIRCNSKSDVTEVAKFNHSYKADVTAPTCTAKGYTTYTCSVCGDNYKSDEKAALGHNMSDYKVTVQPTCTDKGTETAACSRCTHTETKSVAAKGHNYKDGICTGCGKSKVENCKHLCHKKGFMGFIWKIVRFFWKFFKMNPTCECGVKHY